jgi:glucose-1-phosphatase
MTIRAIVFDLAGVLVDFGGPESLHRLSGGRIGNEEFFRFWQEAPCAHDFTCGRCSPKAFAAAAVRELQLTVTPDAFLDEYRTWLKGPYPGAPELLRQLRPLYRVACLSNTNEIHVKRFDKELRLPEWFDMCFYSNELGMRKPEPRIYAHVSHTLEVPANEIVFFDDSRTYVDGATQAGMHAYHVTGFDEVRTLIENSGLLNGRFNPLFWMPSS